MVARRPLSAATRQRLSAAHSSACEFLGEAEEAAAREERQAAAVGAGGGAAAAAEASRNGESFLFEGQLSGAAEPSAAPLEHTAPFAAVVNALHRAAEEAAEAHQVPGNSRAAGGGRGDTVGDAVADVGVEAATTAAVVREEESDELSEAERDALERVLAESLEEARAVGLGGAPPAARWAVDGLRTHTLDAQGAAAACEPCAVCQESFAEGDLLLTLPCSHRFHRECARSWLLEHRCSCPTCRAELPTGTGYDDRREREQEEDAARRGAANALRGGDAMYM